MTQAQTVLLEVKQYHGRVKNYINGQWIDSTTKEWLDVTNPATGSVIAEVPLSTEEEVRQAVQAAHEAFKSWRDVPPPDRTQYLFAFKHLLEEHREELARIVTQENGKSIVDARGEVQRAIQNVEVATGAGSLMMGYNLEDIARGIDEDCLRQPMGVFCAIVPFNFPAMVAEWFMPYAIACGNTYIIKPSEQVPLSLSLCIDLLHKTGIPKGVINLVNGAKGVVDALLDSPEVRGVSFVGSTGVAKYVYQKATTNGKRAQCQGGAKNFMVAMPDAQLDKTVDNLIGSFYGGAGQRCLAGSVLLAVGDVYEPIKERLLEAAKKIRVGNGLDESANMGPVISKKHQDKVLGYIDQGVKEGAKLILDGRDVSVEGCPDGAFIGPCVFDDVTPDMTIAQEEIFGPVAAIIRVNDLDEAIGIIEANRYGNAASIFTSDGKSAREFKHRVPVGNVGINVGVAAPISFFPFSGMKESFFGDLHGQGQDAIEFFTEKKVVITRWF
jgi:malonate-semialdehyde dehydrogenase (acetylating)/methylmalonate-semialdehyde dehydrogenase